MENQQKPRNVDGVESNVKVVESSRNLRFHDMVLRILGLLLTLVAAILEGVDKETKTIPFSFLKTLPHLQVHVTAKWQYMSAFMYLLVSNAIACSYAAGSLIYSLAAGRAKDNVSTLVIIILDMVITGLLFSANGAAAAIGVIGRYGNSHLQWNKVCYMFEGFCRQLTAAVILSLLGSFVFLLLVVLAVVNLHKKLMR